MISAVATITTKGQVTIPKEIREYLQLHTGDKIEIVATDNREAIIRPISKTVDEIFGKLHKPGKRPISPEAMDDAVREKNERSMEMKGVDANILVRL